MKVSVGLVIAMLMMLGGCTAGSDEGPPPRSFEKPVTSKEAGTECRPGKPVKIEGGMRIPQRCPASDPEDTGYNERIRLGSVLAELPCRELPDFAGSFWRVAKPHPRGLAMVGHDDIPGKMTLISRDQARFIGGPIRMSMGRSKRMMRFPAKGQLEVKFERINGAVAVGGCD